MAQADDLDRQSDPDWADIVRPIPVRADLTLYAKPAVAWLVAEAEALADRYIEGMKAGFELAHDLGEVVESRLEASLDQAPTGVRLWLKGVFSAHMLVERVQGDLVKERDPDAPLTLRFFAMIFRDASALSIWNTALRSDLKPQVSAGNV